MKIAAIIPMRKNSRRVPKKNLKNFNGRPLFKVILEKLKKIDIINNIYVDTNDEDIKKILIDEYPDVAIINRPDHLSSEFESVNNILDYDLNYMKEDIILQTHVTNPLLRSESIIEALQLLMRNISKGFDSVFSVTRMYERYWDKDVNPVNHNPNKLERTQDLPVFYKENSCMYIFTRSGFYNANKNRLGSNRLVFELDEYESTDIDYPIDFEFAEFLEKKLFSNYN